jgi:hypothetical protein
MKIEQQQQEQSMEQAHKSTNTLSCGNRRRIRST